MWKMLRLRIRSKPSRTPYKWRPTWHVGKIEEENFLSKNVQYKLRPCHFKCFMYL
jgi:hypothetical protein